MDVTTLDSIAERLNVSGSLRDITARAAYAATKNRVRKAMAEMSIIGTKAVAHISAAMAQPFDFMHEVDDSTPAGAQWQLVPGMLSLANSLYKMASEQVADYQENGGQYTGSLNTDLRASKDMINHTQDVYTYRKDNDFYE